jgi:hypothetical protein
MWFLNQIFEIFLFFLVIFLIIFFILLYITALNTFWSKVFKVKDSIVAYIKNLFHIS